jgi:hypothetical protein
MSVQIRGRLNRTKCLKRLEARVGFEPVSRIDATQLIHFTTRQKRQNGQISRIEVHAGYTAERMPRPFVFSGKKKGLV